MASRILVCLLLSLPHLGCVLGPCSVQNSRTNYNRAVEATNREELLLNLVRMRYHDSNEFVRIATINQQYQYDASVGATGRWQERTPNILTSALGLGALSKPTITIVPEQDQEFTSRLLTPIRLEALLLLASKGWAADRVLRMTVRQINDVENGISAGGPTPQLKPEFETYTHVAKMFRELQKHGHRIEIAYKKLVDEKAVSTGQRLPTHLVDGEDLVAAANSGHQFRPSADGTYQELWKKDVKVDTLVLRVAPDGAESMEWGEITRLLELDPKVDDYQLKTAKRGQLLQPHGRRVGLEGINNRDSLVISTRSLKEMMFYLSHAIRVPDDHLTEGLVTATFDSDGCFFDWERMSGDLLRVHCSKWCPKDAAVKVKHEGYWFYIENADRNSQNTFNLLLELFNLEIRGGGVATAPVFTL